MFERDSDREDVIRIVEYFVHFFELFWRVELYVRMSQQGNELVK